MSEISLPEPLPRDVSPRQAAAMAWLVDIATTLSEVRDIATLGRLTAAAARALLGSEGATFVLREGDEGHVVEQSADDKRWKGARFPLSGTITGTAILTGKVELIPDMWKDSRIPKDAADPGQAQSLLVVPIRRTDPVGAIVVNWAYFHPPDVDDVAILQALADLTSVAWENVRLFNALADKIKGLEAQQVRIRAQHESLEVFARALAHDLREPVRTVRAFTELIADSEEPEKDKALYFDLIRRAADRMGMLVDTVFQYTQLDDPARLVLKPVDMNQIASSVTANLAQLIREQEVQVIAGNLPVVEGHGAHILQLVQNLVVNAIRHGPKGVRIDITAEEIDGQWRFLVADNGPGLDAADCDRIFLPFKRLNLNEEGAGLGLAICRKVVTLHGGRIWCEPDTQGGRFYFTLPGVDMASGPQPKSYKSDEVRLDRADAALAHVLLVDDREADLELTRVLLQVRDRLQFKLTTARGGVEALERLRHAHANGEHFDLLLLDINMPGMSGFEMLEALRNDPTLPPVAVVMCSGSTYDDDLRRAETLGAAGYMVKPPSLEQLKPIMAGLPDLMLLQQGEGSRLMRAA